MSSEFTSPLKFEPIYKRRIWGGDRLHTVLGRKLPRQGPIGESWELSDHGQDVSFVSGGEFAGRSLGDLMQRGATELIGTVPGSRRFPLLIKWIDAGKTLSVQVHPPDGHPLLRRDEQGKTECWFVLAADPGSKIYLGLKKGMDRNALQREIIRGTTEHCLNAHEARAGDFYLVPAGTVHAIGGGVLLAEIQQSSDTTFRMFDWNRVDPETGKGRELHVPESLDCIDFDSQPPQPNRSSGTPRRRELVTDSACPYFSVVYRREGQPVTVGGRDRGHILMVLSGETILQSESGKTTVSAGETVLLAASRLFSCQPRTEVEFLDVWIP